MARDFDLTETAVREWVKQAERDAGTRGDGLTSSEREELAYVAVRDVERALSNAGLVSFLTTRILWILVMQRAESR